MIYIFPDDLECSFMHETCTHGQLNYRTFHAQFMRINTVTRNLLHNY